MSPRPRQAGFTLVAGVFLLVILAALGAFILTVSSTQQLGAAYDLLGARAYQAARAGVEWGAFQALRSGSCAGTTSFGLAGTLSEFAVSVQASETTADELGTTVRVCALVATACNQPSGGVCPSPVPGANYVERQIQATVAR